MYPTRFEDVPVITVDGVDYKITRLLQDGDSNAKLRKSKGRGFATAGLSLAPHKMSGVGNVCPFASNGCIEACLNHQGLAAIFRRIQQARTARSVAWYTFRPWFIEKLTRELESRVACAARKCLRLASRLNVYSDIQWEQYGIFEMFPSVQFYDYTKNPRRVGRIAKNYWVTFSRSESNEADCLDVLRDGNNVAVVFADAQNPYITNRSYLQGLPKTWHGFPVVDGDVSDLRFEDPRGRKRGRVVGLRLKASSTAEREQAISSGFAVVWN